MRQGAAQEWLMRIARPPTAVAAPLLKQERLEGIDGQHFSASQPPPASASPGPASGQAPASALHQVTCHWPCSSSCCSSHALVAESTHPAMSCHTLVWSLCKFHA
jgi:hypothetical protein